MPCHLPYPRAAPLLSPLRSLESAACPSRVELSRLGELLGIAVALAEPIEPCLCGGHLPREIIRSRTLAFGASQLSVSCPSGLA